MTLKNVQVDEAIHGIMKVLAAEQKILLSRTIELACIDFIDKHRRDNTLQNNIPAITIADRKPGKPSLKRKSIPMPKMEIKAMDIKDLPQYPTADKWDDHIAIDYTRQGVWLSPNNPITSILLDIAVQEDMVAVGQKHILDDMMGLEAVIDTNERYEPCGDTARAVLALTPGGRDTFSKELLYLLSQSGFKINYLTA